MIEKEKALNKFLCTIGEINEKLELIKAHCVDNHMNKDPEDVNWSITGDAGHVNEMLNEIIVFLNLK